MFATVKLPDGTVIAELDNPAVPQCILNEIQGWKEQGVSIQDIVQRLRPRTVPSGYVFHNWRAGRGTNTHFNI